MKNLSECPVETLSEYLKLELATKKVKPAQLAKEIKVAFSTLRGWIYHNRFPRRGWTKIADFLNLPRTDEKLQPLVKERLRNQIFDDEREGTPLEKARNLEEILRIIDKRVPTRVRSLFEDVSDAARHLLRVMDANELFVFSALNVTPMELEPTNSPVAEMAVHALERGATLLYVRPSNRVLDLLRTDFDQRWLPSGTDIREDYEQFVALAKTLARPSRAGGVRPDKWNIAQVYFGELSPFCMPGIAIAYYQTKDGMKRLTLRIPSGVPSASQASFSVPGDEAMTARFILHLRRLLNQTKLECTDPGAVRRALALLKT